MSRLRWFTENYTNLFTLRECAMYGLGMATGGLLTIRTADGVFLTIFGTILIALTGVSWIVENHPVPGTKEKST